MFVRSVMMPKSECYTASLNQTLQEVLEAFDQYDIEGMPVVNQDKYVGMITKRSVFEHYFDSSEEDKNAFLANHSVSELLTAQDVYVDEDDVFENALKTLKGEPILAVVDTNRTFLGIVSRYDVIETFESVFGMKKKGTRIALSVTEQEGTLYRLTDILRHHHANVISLSTFDETGKLNRRIVVKVDITEQTEQFVDELKRAGFRILDVKTV